MDSCFSCDGITSYTDNVIRCEHTLFKLKNEVNQIKTKKIREAIEPLINDFQRQFKMIIKSKDITYSSINIDLEAYNQKIYDESMKEIEKYKLEKETILKLRKQIKNNFDLIYEL